MHRSKHFELYHISILMVLDNMPVLVQLYVFFYVYAMFYFEPQALHLISIFIRNYLSEESLFFFHCLETRGFTLMIISRI